MKILEVCMSKGFGGLELYVLKCSHYLSASDVEFNVLTKKNSFLYNKMLDSQIQSDSFNSVFHHLPIYSALKLAKYIKTNNIDVLHIHWGKDLLFAVLGKLFSRRKVKLVYTRQMALTRKKNDIYHRFLYRNVDSYLVITRSLYDEALKYLPLEKKRIHILYYGVPKASNALVDTCESYITKTGLDTDAFKLAIFGRIEKGKGQHLVVEAVKNLKSQDKNIQLVIVGHVMDENYFKQLQSVVSEHHLQKNILFLGFHDNPTSIMPCFDAVVLASKCETFGLVLAEAMRAGVTVIGSNCGGVPEIIKHEKTGLLFDTENAQDLTKQLAKIVDDARLCNTLAIAGKIDADERFSEEKHFNTLVKLFESA